MRAWNFFTDLPPRLIIMQNYTRSIPNFLCCTLRSRIANCIVSTEGARNTYTFSSVLPWRGLGKLLAFAIFMKRSEKSGIGLRSYTGMSKVFALASLALAYACLWLCRKAPEEKIATPWFWEVLKENQICDFSWPCRAIMLTWYKASLDRLEIRAPGGLWSSKCIFCSRIQKHYAYALIIFTC